MKASRNEACPCGSGKKFKACCAGKRPASQWVATVSVVVFVVLAAWVLAGTLRDSGKEAEATGVWSEEHGHFHDAASAAKAAQPPGPAPPGKVWNAEHGHWHDAPLPGTAQPEEPAPPGKVWNAEHGHWHDAAAPSAVAPAEPAESDVSYVDESSP